MTDPVAGTHDQALIHWMDQHRTYLLQLVYHVIYTLHVLPDGDEHALAAAITEREGLGHAATEVARHLSEADLPNTSLWRRYVGLAFGTTEAEWWRTAYRTGGGDGVKTAALAELEAAAAELEHPPAPSLEVRRLLDQVYWYEDAARQMHELIQQTRDALTTLGHHPHDEHARDAAQQSWTALTQAGQEIARRLANARDSEVHMSSQYKLRPTVTWTEVALGMYQQFVVDATDAAAIQTAAFEGHQDVATAVHHLQQVLWVLAGHVNGADPR